MKYRTNYVRRFLARFGSGKRLCHSYACSPVRMCPLEIHRRVFFYEIYSHTAIQIKTGFGVKQRLVHENWRALYDLASCLFFIIRQPSLCIVHSGLRNVFRE